MKMVFRFHEDIGGIVFPMSASDIPGTPPGNWTGNHEVGLDLSCSIDPLGNSLSVLEIDSILHYNSPDCI